MAVLVEAAAEEEEEESLSKRTILPAQAKRVPTGWTVVWALTADGKCGLKSKPIGLESPSIEIVSFRLPANRSSSATLRENSQHFTSAFVPGWQTTPKRKPTNRVQSWPRCFFLYLLPASSALVLPAGFCYIQMDGERSMLFLFYRLISLLYISTLSPWQIENVRMLDRYNNRKPSTGTLYLTATHLIFVDPDAKKETWVISRFWKWKDPQRKLWDGRAQPDELIQLLHLFSMIRFFWCMCRPCKSCLYRPSALPYRSAARHFCRWPSCCPGNANVMTSIRV